MKGERPNANIGRICKFKNQANQIVESAQEGRKLGGFDCVNSGDIIPISQGEAH